MKKTGFLFLFVLFLLHVHAQVNLEKSTTESTWIAQLQNSGYKYFSMDVTNNQCKIYNLDFSPWKTIALSIPTGYTLYDVQFVSENLFSTDGQIGLAYMYYQYNSVQQYYTYGVKIIKEDGTVLVTSDGAAYMYTISTGENGTKFLVYLFDYSTWPYFIGTEIYSVPGNLVGQQSVSPENLNADRYAYPNPAGSSITIPIPQAPGDGQGALKIIDPRGSEISSVKLTKNQSEFRLNTTSFPRGNYHYLILSDGKMVINGSFIVEKR